MGTMLVTDYRVGTNRSRTNSNAHRYYLSLSGNSISGPVTRAIVYFWPSKPADTVGYLAGDLAVGILDDSDFEQWYNILRSESPIRLYYIENSDPAENRFWHIGIGTNEEPVGEGLADADA